MDERSAGGGDPRGYGRHYSEKSLWRKVGAMPRSAGVAVIERALLLYVILADRDTPMWARALIVGALGYFVCPLDAAPDSILGVGYIDDMAVMGLVLSQVGRLATPATRERVQRLMPAGMKRRTNGTKGDGMNGF